jgi:hypothetical protein
MSRLQGNGRWYDFGSRDVAIELQSGIVIVWASGSFRYVGCKYERGLELVAEGRAKLKELEVIP